MQSAYEFPQNVEERLNVILKSVNTEPKQVLLIHALDRHYRTCSDLYRRLEIVFSEKALIPSPWNISGNCHSTLSPFLVEEGVTEKFNPFGLKMEMVRQWRKNETGEKYGGPAAAFSMMYGIEHGRSMYEYLGPTATIGETGAPYRRFRIIELVGQGRTTEKEISEGLGPQAPYIEKHIRHLCDLGLLEFSSVSLQRKGQFRYRWAGKEPAEIGHLKYLRGQRALTQKVIEKLREMGEADYNEISDALNYHSPGNVSSVLSNLADQGIALRVGPFKTGERLSKVSLTESGTGFLQNFCPPMRNAMQDGGELEEMRETLYRLQETGALGKSESALELYRQVRPSNKIDGLEQRRTQVLQFLESFRRNSGTWPRRRDVVLSSPMLGNYLKPFVREGLLEKIEEDGRGRGKGKIVRYAIPSASLEKIEVLQ